MTREIRQLKPFTATPIMPQGKHLNKHTGYVMVYLPHHPRSNGFGYVYEHVVMAESALGKPLPPAAVVHHVNGFRWENRPGNLVVCQDTKYHHLLHVRQRALEACGNPNLRKCYVCRQYDDPAVLVEDGRRRRHAICKRRYKRKTPWRGELVTLTCPGCGNEFQRHKYAIPRGVNRGREMHCSKSCAFSHRARKRA